MNLLRASLAGFAESVASGEVDIYNEFSLQHELGLFLRSRISGLKIQFERNVQFFFPNKSEFVKREIDIAAFNPTERIPAFALELKFPRNGQHPEQMFSFCKDIAFAEQLVRAGFQNAAVIIFAEDHLFYSGSTEGIYGFFRGGRPLHGKITKPTGKKDDEVEIRGTYTVSWRKVNGKLSYSIIEAQHVS